MNSICKNSSNVLDYGDLCVLYSSDRFSKEIVLRKGGCFESHNGIFLHSKIAGSKYGQKVYSESMRDSLYILKASSTLHTSCLNHRTQILYAPDISMVLFQCDMKPGDIVIESGTGSGSLSMSIGKTIFPDGHLYTFEFNEQRVKAAKKEFEEMGFDKNITVTHRDAIENGFNLEIEKENEEKTNLLDKADSVFLDLPSPVKG